MDRTARFPSIRYCVDAVGGASVNHAPCSTNQISACNFTRMQYNKLSQIPDDPGVCVLWKLFYCIFIFVSLLIGSGILGLKRKKEKTSLTRSIHDEPTSKLALLPQGGDTISVF